MSLSSALNVGLSELCCLTGSVGSEMNWQYDVRISSVCGGGGGGWFLIFLLETCSMASPRPLVFAVRLSVTSRRSKSRNE